MMSKSLILKVQILGVSEPEVWRRIVIPPGASFHHLNCAIQYCFGWKDIVTYVFGNNEYCDGLRLHLPVPEDWLEENYDPYIDSQTVMLSEYLKQPGDTMYYEFSGDWRHSIVVEEIAEGYGPLVDCLTGEGACPPYGWGGDAYSYRQLKHDLKNNIKNDKADFMRQWMELEEGETFDPYRLRFQDIHTRLQIWLDNSEPKTLDTQQTLDYDFHSDWWNKKYGKL